MLEAITSRLPLDRVSDGVWAVNVLRERGVFGLIRPDKAARIAHRYIQWGTTPALGSMVTAIEHPDEVGIVDEIGELTFAESDRRSNALARGLQDLGVEAGDGVAIMCRNHRYFVEATMAAAKLGAVCLYLNTAFAAPQLKEVMQRESTAALIYDEEFAELLDAENRDEVKRVIGWKEEGAIDDPSVDDLVEANDDSRLPAPEESGRYVILTSGTTGTPKGAQRGSPEGLTPLAAFLSKIPREGRETVLISAPLFHSWGFSHFVLGLPLAATMVLRRKFDPEDALKQIQDHKARTLVVVPVMMQRILELGDDVISKYDLSSLEVTAASGSALPGELATKWMDTFGDNLYNLYGSTEVAWATIATPEDMREAPGTAGKPPRGTVIRIVDEDGKDLPPGETGRIFVGNEMSFEGYTGGDDKERLEDLLSSGDVGHFDESGRLFIDGRDDEMIVSGGENVFPREVEDLLSDHDAVAEVAVIGVDDEQFGQRLKAFVVKANGKDADEGELKGYVKENLARYKVPREIEFLEELPRNATGKVLKRELADDTSSDN
jgi:acyl-CoA synthetase (AMP-forming)/AMP-acid ligase II